MGRGIRYWGKKNLKFLQSVSQLIPFGCEEFVDCCFGSGNFTRQISCEFGDVKKKGYEMDRALFELHKVIAGNDFFEMLRKIPLSVDKETFESYRIMAKDFNDGTNKESESAVNIVKEGSMQAALAELILLYFSMNGTRLFYRNPESYLKHKDERRKERTRKQLLSLQRIFETQVPVDLLDLHFAWRDVELCNEDFRKHFEEIFGNEKCFAFVDPPYLMNKRGLKQNTRAVSAGYDVDWVLEDHLSFVSELIKLKKENRLKAATMICSSFEIDESGKLLEVKDDPYTKLLTEADFRMVIIQIKATSAILTSDNMRKKRKAEVVFVNYKDSSIYGNWDDFSYFDASDVEKEFIIKN